MARGQYLVTDRRLPLGRAERWKPTRYRRVFVSNFGRVRVSRHRARKVQAVSWRMLEPVMYRGRACVRLEAAQNYISVARLVAEAFLPRAPKRARVYHKNGHLFDCAAWNLYRDGPPFYAEDLPLAVEQIKAFDGWREDLIDFLIEHYNVHYRLARALIERVRHAQYNYSQRHFPNLKRTSRKSTR